jgi:hypothetical protein
MPHIYVLDTLILTILGYLIAHQFARLSLIKGPQPVKVLAGMGIVSLLLVALLQAFVWTTGWWPTASIPKYGSDRYIDFRPAFMVDPNKNGRCFN